MDLIPDVRPPNAKELLALCAQYKKAQASRLKALTEEKKFKTQLLALVKESGLVPLPDGKIVYMLDDDHTLVITPRDELVQVKDRSGEVDDGEDGEA